MTLALPFHNCVEGIDGTDGTEEEVSEPVSSASYAETAEGVEGMIGAARKCIPRGVGKRSLMGDSHCSIFSPDLDLFIPVRSAFGTWDIDIVIVISSPSSSIMGFSVLPSLRPCGEGGRYVAAGKRMKSAIF